MASKPLTTKAIDAAKGIKEVRQEIPDGAQPGLYLVVQPSGAKSWAVRYRHGNRTRKLTLGTVQAVTLADARKAAFAAITVAASGRDPAIERAAAIAGNRSDRSLVENVLDEFVKRHVSGKRASTATETKRIIEKHLKPAWRGRAIRTIGRADVLSVLDDITDQGKGYLANRVFATVRKFFNWCTERGIIDASPVGTLRPPAEEQSRDRVLSDAEVRLFWQGCEVVGWPWGDFGKVLLLTAQRREEVAGASRAEFELEGKEANWLIPRERAKNGVESLVPLAPAVVHVLKGLTAVEGEGNFAFSTNGETAISGFSKGKKRLDDAMLQILREDDPEAELVPWRLHDLRRTAASGMAALGQPIHVVEAILNHKSGKVSGVAAIYNRHDYAPEKRRALLAWANKVAATVGRPKDNVVPMKKRSHQ